MGSTRPEVRIERFVDGDFKMVRKVIDHESRLPAGIAAGPGVFSREVLMQLSPERWRVLDQHPGLAPSVSDGVFPGSRALLGLVHPFQEMGREPPALASRRAT